MQGSARQPALVHCAKTAGTHDGVSAARNESEKAVVVLQINSARVRQVTWRKLVFIIMASGVFNDGHISQDLCVAVSLYGATQNEEEEGDDQMMSFFFSVAAVTQHSHVKGSV